MITRSVPLLRRAVAPVLALASLACAVAAVTQPWGDGNEVLDLATPQQLAVAVIVGSVVALVLSTAVGWQRIDPVPAAVCGVICLAVGGAIMAGLLVHSDPQLDPRVGGLLAFCAGCLCALAGLALLLTAALPSGRPSALAAAGLSAALVAAAVVGYLDAGSWWSQRNRDATVALAASGTPPTTVSGIAWRVTLGHTEQFLGVYGGRALIGTWSDRGPCHAGVRGLDAATGREAWHFLVPSRCSIDVTDTDVAGNDQAVRVGFGPASGQLDVFLDPATGRVLDVGAADLAVLTVSGRSGLAQEPRGSTLFPTGGAARVELVDWATGHVGTSAPVPSCASGLLSGPFTVENSVRPSDPLVAASGQQSSWTELGGGAMAFGWSCTGARGTAGKDYVLHPHVTLVEADGRTREVTLPDYSGSAFDSPQLLRAGSSVVALGGGRVIGIDPTGKVDWTRPGDASTVLGLPDGRLVIGNPSGAAAYDPATGARLATVNRSIGRYDRVVGGIDYPSNGTAPFGVYSSAEPRALPGSDELGEVPTSGPAPGAVIAGTGLPSTSEPSVVLGLR